MVLLISNKYHYQKQKQMERMKEKDSYYIQFKERDFKEIYFKYFLKIKFNVY